MRILLMLLARITLCGVMLLTISGCGHEESQTAKISCRDRKTDVDKNTGVKHMTVVLCPGRKMHWSDGGENWVVEFKGNDSPFQGKPMKISKGDQDPVARTGLKQDTTFPYSITVDGKKFDPQIIVMCDDNC
jgi:hypothetical protein